MTHPQIRQDICGHELYFTVSQDIMVEMKKWIFRHYLLFYRRKEEVRVVFGCELTQRFEGDRRVDMFTATECTELINIILPLVPGLILEELFSKEICSIYS